VLHTPSGPTDHETSIGIERETPDRCPVAVDGRELRSRGGVEHDHRAAQETEGDESAIDALGHNEWSGGIRRSVTGGGE